MAGKRLGILGGTFDPVHNGHLWLAEAVYERLGPERVIFIPAYVAPHKVGLQCAPAADRYEMARLAVVGCPHFALSDMELRRSGVSYTLDTVLELRRQYPQQELYFIIGADSLPLLHTWHRIGELLQLVTFAAAGRPGYGQVLERACAKLPPGAEKKIILLDTPEYAVSSTDIRSRVQRGTGLAGLVPPAVEAYIHGHGLYQDNGESE